MVEFNEIWFYAWFCSQKLHQQQTFLKFLPICIYYWYCFVFCQTLSCLGLCVKPPCLLIDVKWPTKKNLFVMKGKNAMVIMEIKCKGCSPHISDCNRRYKTLSALAWNTACSFWPEISSHLRLRNIISFLNKSSKKWQTNRDVYLQRSDMTQGAEEEWPQPSWLDPTWVLGFRSSCRLQ